MTLPIEKQKEIARQFKAGARICAAARAANVPHMTAGRYYQRFAVLGVDAGIRRRRRRPEPANARYTGPEWIGTAIGDPVVQSGDGWIGQKISPLSQNGTQAT